jgi:hypothetical protein
VQATIAMATRWRIPATQPRNRGGEELCPVCKKHFAPGRRTKRTTDGVRIHTTCWPEAIDRTLPG